jgi:hypothetical protein
LFVLLALVNNQIVRYLEGQLSTDALNAGVTPGQSVERDEHPDEETRQLRRVARFVPDTSSTPTGNMSSSYVSEPTSEYGLHPSSSNTSDDDAGTADIADEGMSRRTRSPRDAGTAEIADEGMSRRTRSPRDAGTAEIADEGMSRRTRSPRDAGQ